MIYVAPATGGKSTPVNKSFDQTATELQWAEQGRALYFDSGVKGETHLYRMDASTGATTALTTGPRSVRSASVQGKLIAYLSNDFTHLDDLYVRGDNSFDRQLTHLNTLSGSSAS